MAYPHVLDVSLILLFLSCMYGKLAMLCGSQERRLACTGPALANLKFAQLRYDSARHANPAVTVYSIEFQCTD